MTTYLGKGCSFCLPRVPFVNCRQFMYLVISLLVLRAGYGIWLYQFLIIAYLFTFQSTTVSITQIRRHYISTNTITNAFPSLVQNISKDIIPYTHLVTTFILYSETQSKDIKIWSYFLHISRIPDLPISHKTSELPGLQSQVNPFSPSSYVASFWQGDEAHSLISETHEWQGR